MILLAFRHGLRASEVCDLQWTQVDFAAATLAVTRAKHGTPSTHPLTGRELRALRRLHREAEGRSPFLFVSERGSPMTVSNFQKLISRACEAAGLKKGAPAHAAARLWFPPGERGAGYPVAASLSRAQEHPAYGSLHRTGTDPVQGLVEGLRREEQCKQQQPRHKLCDLQPELRKLYNEIQAIRDDGEHFCANYV
jgi:Phage integrase family